MEKDKKRFVAHSPDIADELGFSPDRCETCEGSGWGRPGCLLCGECNGANWRDDPEACHQIRFIRALASKKCDACDSTGVKNGVALNGFDGPEVTVRSCDVVPCEDDE